ncbi:hypothetical protein [Methylobacterium sp. J-070]|uniref:hypothetical protein n=1 Tax=Methylobacterium sp. J-070 TaxID=2836650 RepID=UPI001FB92AA8|nr:hypothetical protein [Methylobacterium sp. J-070]MCJ2053312.1 hypothetical protein [Methylobacterium sp. J-070]
MPHGARTRLAALILLLGVGGASAEPAAGTTWTDPPTHKPAAETAPARRETPAAPAPTATATPAAAAPARAARRTVAARRPPERRITRSAAQPVRRVAAAPRRPRFVAARPRRIYTPQVVAVVPPAGPPEGDARYRAYGYGPGYADERLERLSSAEAAGYLVVRRRTVQFPDGRTLRFYRPDDGGEPF